MTGDFEKAFLMVSIATNDRDSLRFLWIDNIASSLPKIVMLRFTRVVFGITSSPFLLNATLQLHMKWKIHRLLTNLCTEYTSMMLPVEGTAQMKCLNST